VPEFEYVAANYSAITNLVRTHRLWLIFNGEDYVWRSGIGTNSDYDAFNAAFLFNPDGRCAAIYHKQNLVIFGEYIPLVRWLPFIKWFTPITGSFASGTNAVPFEMNINPERRAPSRRVEQLLSRQAGPEAGAPSQTASHWCRTQSCR
jgi:apolipoprotein N-acyltransferase